jgi:hypothetical protein
MDASYSSPLLDMFRRGEVAHDIRLLAAQGVLAPRASEQLALLVLLCRDSDPVIRQTAAGTVGKIPAGLLPSFLGRPDVSEDVRVFFRERGIDAAADPASGGDDGAPAVESFDHEDEGAAPEAGAAGDGEESADAGGDPDQVRQSTIQRLSLLNVTGKVKAAMRGSREERAVLIRDPNKLVSVAVLSSPKLTAQEVEGFARLGSVSEESLRVIGTNRAWTKNYGVIRGLAANPKTPVGLSLGFLKRLLERDLKQITTDRNIPDPVRLAARRILQNGEGRRG